MRIYALVLAGSFAYGAAGFGQAADDAQPWSADEVAAAPRFTSDQPVVLTSYFYWYDEPSGEHFLNHDGTDALTHHPVDPNTSYRDIGWHRRQMCDIVEAGIDAILPVYWGHPKETDGWSDMGLRVLVEAQEAMLAEGVEPPRIGMFYDTSTLLYAPGGPADLTTQAGRDWFCDTVLGYFGQVPPKLWATIEGQPIVFLYASGFAKAHDQRCIDELRERFAARFGGVTPYIVREVSWAVETESQYAWGGALGLSVHGTAALGPGYDHSAVPGRTPLIVEREDGAFYERSWRALLTLSPSRRPKLVHVETWNELHEGSEICETVECGRLYIGLTRRYADMFRAGVQLERTGPYAQARSVSCDLARPSRGGLTHDPAAADGLSGLVTRQGYAARVAAPNEFGPALYLYFSVDDSFAHDSDSGAYVIRVLYFDDGHGVIALEYDSADPSGSIRDGAFKHGGSVALTNTRRWLSHAFRLEDARFANRTNGADFRLALSGTDIAIRAVRVARP